LHKPALAIALLGLAACAAPPAPNTANPVTTGQALAQAACPLRVAEANAWVNHMPGGARSPRELNVEVKFANLEDTAIIIRSDATRRGDTLVLDIRSTQSAGQLPGRVDYREPVADPPFKRVSIFCRGGEIFSISEIQKVY
jgi:hypothetical protein